MANPDLTPEALKRLVEHLRAQATEFKGFAENAMMLDSPATASCYDHRRGTQEEAAAAISGLMQQLADAKSDYARRHKDACDRREVLMEIEAEMRAWRKDPRLDWPRNQIGRILSHQGGEG